MEILEDGIILRTHSHQADLIEENGLLVHEGEASGELARLVEQTRTDRDNDVLGLLP